MTGASGPRYLSPKNAALRYDTSKNTIYAHLKLDHFRAVKHNRRTLINVESADKYFDGLPPVQLGNGRT
jgi:hypothetical protein